MIDKFERDRKFNKIDSRLVINDDYYAIAFYSTTNMAKELDVEISAKNFAYYFYNCLFVLTL